MLHRRWFASAVLGCAVACGSSGASDSVSPGTPLDPTQPHYGKTYGEWSAAWWEYVYAQPGTTNPLLDTTGAHCAVGQSASASVFFLVGDEGGAVERTCTVPKGLAIFFPIVNSASDNGGVPAAQQQSDAALLASANTQLSSILKADLTASFDGVPIANLASYVITPPVKFSYTLPAGDNLYSALGTPGVSGVVSPSYSTGYYVMLSPPSPGKHVLKFGGEATGSPSNFTLSVTYNLVIQ